MPNGIGICSWGREELGLFDPSYGERAKTKKKKNTKLRGGNVSTSEKKANKKKNEEQRS